MAIRSRIAMRNQELALSEVEGTPALPGSSDAVQGNSPDVLTVPVWGRAAHPSGRAQLAWL